MTEKLNIENPPDFRAMRRRLIELDEQGKKDYYQEARRKAAKVALMLKQEYGVTQIYLYGSLAWGGFDQDSDIDLFLLGFTGNYWEAYSKSEAVTAPINVSLLCEEDSIDSLKYKVLRKGELL